MNMIGIFWANIILIFHLSDKLQKLFLNSRDSYHRCEQCVELVNPCETKVCQFDNAVSCNKQILRLQIPVDYTMTVQKVNTTQYLPYDVLQCVQKWKQFKVSCKMMEKKILRILYIWRSFNWKSFQYMIKISNIKSLKKSGNVFSARQRKFDSMGTKEEWIVRWHHYWLVKGTGCQVIKIQR